MEKQSLTTVGSVVSAFFASICCIGPLVFAVLGVVGAGIATSFEKYRPLFIGVTIAFLGLAFFLTYRKPKQEECDPGSTCEVSGFSKWNKVVLWIVTVIVILLILFPNYVGYLV